MTLTEAMELAYTLVGKTAMTEKGIMKIDQIDFYAVPKCRVVLGDQNTCLYRSFEECNRTADKWKKAEAVIAAASESEIAAAEKTFEVA